MKRTKFWSDQDELSKYFNKVFQFQNTGNWSLPRKIYNAEKFVIPELQDLKHQLNNVKGKLSQFDLAEWSIHTRNRDVAGFVMSVLRKKIRPELLTQAWCKFYEIVSRFPLVPSDEASVFRSLHLCEAPGAFICALNHYLVIHQPHITWQWSANTLNPDYEGNAVSDMIPDDRLICHTHKHWEFGADLTGDLTKYYNHCEIIKKVITKDKIGLVTADGSIDCMIDPGEQERLVEFLHYCETMTALAVLKKGGSFVLKIFTIFEESTVCLMYLLNCMFDQVSVFKPCTSKSGNSELYVICTGFHGNDVLDSIWDNLVEPYKNGHFKENISMFSFEDIPYSFKIQVISCCSDFFLERQMQVIEENIYHFLNNDSYEGAALHQLKINIASEYIKKYRLKPIPKYRKIVPYVNVHDHKTGVDTLIDSENYFLSRSVSFKEYCFDKYLDIIYGRQIDFVNNSKFATIEYLDSLKKHLYKRLHKPLLYSLVLKNVSISSIVINGNEFDIIPHYRFQRDLFTKLSSAICENKHIILINVPFHTHFLAAVWCILASLFDNVYFGPGWTIFYEPLHIKQQVVKNIFSVINNAYNSISSNIVPLDIVNIFKADVFFNDLNFVPDILKVCNYFYSPNK